MDAMKLRLCVSAAFVAAMAVSLAACAALLFPALRPVTLLWCFVPAAWGLWGLLTPASWVPRRLPLWGAILGLGAGTLAGPVLDLPSRVAGAALSLATRSVAIPIAAAGYYLLWMLVAAVYRRLSGTTDTHKAAGAAA